MYNRNIVNQLYFNKNIYWEGKCMLTCAQNHRNDTVRISQLVPACVFLFSPGQWKLCSHCLKCSFPRLPASSYIQERALGRCGRWPVEEAGGGPWQGVFPVIGWKLCSQGGEGPTCSQRGGPELTGASPASLSRHPTARAAVYSQGRASLHPGPLREHMLHQTSPQSPDSIRE